MSALGQPAPLDLFRRIGALAQAHVVGEALAGPSLAAVAEPRHALVVWNASYAKASLTKPVNDARAVATALRKVGFTVDLKLAASPCGRHRHWSRWRAPSAATSCCASARPTTPGASSRPWP